MKKLNYTQIAFMVAAGIVILPIGHFITYNTSWSYSEPLMLLATAIEGALSCAVGLIVYKLFVGLKKP